MARSAALVKESGIILRQLALRCKVLADCLDHNGRTTGIDLVMAHIRMVSDYSLMDKACTSSPSDSSGRASEITGINLKSGISLAHDWQSSLR